MEAANQVVAKHVVRHNPQFAVAVLDSATAWRPRPLQLDQVFCFKFHGGGRGPQVHFDGLVIDIARPGTPARARVRSSSVAAGKPVRSRVARSSAKPQPSAAHYSLETRRQRAELTLPSTAL